MASAHSEEFKRDAVRIALTSGLTRWQASSDLGIGMSTLIKWIKTCRLPEIIRGGEFKVGLPQLQSAA
jgi:transposase